METITLDHDQYTESINNISDDATYRFALQAEKWWNRHFSWKQDGCSVLMDDSGTHLAYLFYKVDRYREYLTIHNLFTPQVHRNRGYARSMLREAFSDEADREVKRFRMSCTSQALGFYAELTLVYWGIDESGNYHCDLPLPENGISGIPDLLHNHTDRELLGSRADAIYQKVKENGERFDTRKHQRFQDDKKMLADAYRHNELKAILEE